MRDIFKLERHVNQDLGKTALFNVAIPLISQLPHFLGLNSQSWIDDVRGPPSAATLTLSHSVCPLNS